ncbi:MULTISPECIES: thiamine-phosphate kinase [unclassified Sphingomonas]|uniref:thiamine-phosphate kinase n=1 Tax=unclassified Sphingomonas TaxID=196159 RepID=UPI00092B4777|nr:MULTISPECIES: thiamine-phosphate kinase [unclassified Sphingomonas]MBN8849559.1 thiamine-phosphate kinase [Sphingomonas sp.]OJV31077.1 MAG: thiamine-phosphate kinase [Sphingomonas sp. 67-36]
MIEAEFIAALRRLPLHPGALGLADDAARLGGYVLTTDTMVEGVHFLATDPPEDIAWKLVATNLSDLAAKGARPEGALLNYPLGEDKWDRAFLAGLDTALAALDCPLIGGDTVSLPEGAARVLTLTAIGADAVAPARSGALPGDDLWVTGTIGDAGAGLAIARGAAGPAALLAAYRRPRPRVAEGRLLAAHVHAMMDVSDGLLIDAWRMAAASGCAVAIDLARVPLSADYRATGGDALAAATAGDDYQLLFAAAPDAPLPVPATCVGTFVEGSGLSLTEGDRAVPLPPRLGFEHRA